MFSRLLLDRHLQDFGREDVTGQKPRRLRQKKQWLQRS
jgi:hypothetical protein